MNSRIYRQIIAAWTQRAKAPIIRRNAEEFMVRRRLIGCIVATGLVAANLAGLVGAFTAPAVAQIIAPKVDTVAIPTNVDVFNLSFDEVKKFSAFGNFELLGHSYFKIPERTPFAKGFGRPGAEIGAGFNTVRVYDGIAYLAGNNSPPTLFGILIADVRDPRNIKPLSFIPCNSGTRCNYLRVNWQKKILIFAHDYDPRDNPDKQPAGEKTRSGVSFYDVSDPAKPKELAFVPAEPDGKTHGLDADDRYVYACSQFSSELRGEGLTIIDYSNPAAPKQVSTWHVSGQRKGEQFGLLNRNGPDGKPQVIACHEVVAHNDRLYLAWRDAGALVLDVKDRAAPRLLGTYDYVPPFHGGNLGAAHTSAPVVTKPGEHPDILVHTDEIFDCPPGFGRILDVSDLKNPEVVRGERPANMQLLSTFRIAHVTDVFDPQNRQFICEGGGPSGRSASTTHSLWFDQRSPSLVYITWYDEGVRAMDISNPFAPAFIGHFLSPRFAPPGRTDRHTREIFQDPDTGLLYVTDGSGGGLMILRYTGTIPDRLPIPGGR
jgi:hypothetical protein